MAAIGYSVICCAETDIPADRKALGWTHDTNSESSVQYVVSPSIETVLELTTDQPETTLHIFSGIRWYRNIVLGLKCVRKTTARIAIYSEPRDNTGIKGQIRVLQSLVTEGWLRDRVSFVLAIGAHGPSWFSQVGYADMRIFPFAYFQKDVAIPRQPCIDSLVRAEGSPIRVGFVGRLVPEKGVRILAEAMSYLKSRASLIWVGDGSDRGYLERYCASRAIDSRFTGVLGMTEARTEMRTFDVLVLPSLTKDDGWGAVVSEALILGCAAVTSSAVGSSILLKQKFLGAVVDVADARGVADAILQLQENGGYTREARERRMQWARNRLTSSSGARNLNRIIDHVQGLTPRPEPFFD